MSSSTELSEMGTRELVTLARDRYRELGACIHPDWSRYLHTLSVESLEAVLSIDAEVLATELNVISEALEDRGRLLDAACCWGQVGSFHSKFSPYEPAPSGTSPRVPKHLEERAPDVCRALERWWRFRNFVRAAPVFGRAGLAFIRAFETLGDRAGSALQKRTRGNPKATGLILDLNFSLEDLGRESAQDDVWQCIFRLQPLWCARGVLFCLDQPGVPAASGTALELLVQLETRWDEWTDLLAEAQAVDPELSVTGVYDERLEDDLRGIRARIANA